MDPAWFALPGCLIWIAILVLPWRPWSARESLDGDTSLPDDLDDVTVLIPARNEQDCIARTLRSVAAQGRGHRIILIDDQSTDATVAEAAGLNLAGLRILPGQTLPPGWTGKLWALEQGRREAATDYLLLLDADIELLPGTLPALRAKLRSEGRQLVSLMAFLRMQNFWEKLLMPAFIYFFKLLYPFHLSNSGSRFTAAAAGGCILIESRALAAAGGFAAIRGALIDDCRLARCIRDAGGSTWIGLTHSARSHRRYENLGVIWDMVARTAYTQLHYSPWLLGLCTLLMAATFLLPVAVLFTANPAAIAAGAAALGLMWISYLPTLKYYNLYPAWGLALPAVGALYLLMTWSSARRYWKGSSAVWKDRVYDKQAERNTSPGTGHKHGGRGANF
jgi:hopene-associated glycosyltransferase HpnB